jgi:hypothetical protein
MTSFNCAGQRLGRVQAVASVIKGKEDAGGFCGHEIRALPCSFCAYPFLESDNISVSVCERLLHELCKFTEDMLYNLKVLSFQAVMKIKKECALK